MRERERERERDGERERRDEVYKVKALYYFCCNIFKNGVPDPTNSYSVDVDFITTEGDFLQEYSCSISPSGERGCISRAVDLRLKTIPGMCLPVPKSPQLTRHFTTIMMLTVSVGGWVSCFVTVTAGRPWWDNGWLL